MTPEHWQQVDELFQAAIDLRPEDRASFLDKACASDANLRAEIEALITSDEHGLSFIEAPAFEMAANLLVGKKPELSDGHQLGAYKILALLGKGGMGEVYLAEDTEPGRKIAIKLLPAEFTRDKERLRRFRQEARAASALNHPNILTIHQIGQADGRYFIATEFIDGETLRQRMNRSRLSVGEAIDIGAQIGGALAAAHQAGIVHRDIKPENIRLRQDGYVKVLDFGLAKLTNQREPSAQAQAAENVNISSGLVMGTVKYMSPEQTRGLEIDARSDIFSFGAVLYEMVTGHAPFKGKTTSDLVAAIQMEETAPLAEYFPQADQELQRIISKALRKDKIERYQTTQELLTDLRNLKEALEIESKLRGGAEPTNRSPKTGASLMVAALMLAALAVSFGLYRYFKLRSAPFENIAVTKFTNFDDASEPSISPDGKYVVYKKGPGTEGHGKFSLWVRAVGATAETQIVPATEGEMFRTSFSPDGKYISYTARLSNQPVAAFVIPTMGGSATKLPLMGAAHASFSPAGMRLAYLDNRLPEGKTVVVVANSDGSNARDIFTRQAPNYYYAAIKPSWSSDGKLIACVGQNGTESFPRVFVVNVETGTERPVTAQKWTNMRGVAWLPDMRGLLVAASEETSSIQQIWQISYPGGAARRITHDTVNYTGLDLSADGKALVTTKVEAPTSIWVMPVGPNHSSPVEKTATLSVDTGKARQINVTNFTGASAFEASARLYWTPDGRRIVYMSEESGNADIWTMNADGSDRRQLTTDAHWDTAAVISRDGRYIAFMSNRAGAENIWLMDMDGGNQRRLTSKLIERRPVFSADSKWVYFTSWETGKATIWKIPVEGGDSIQVIADLSFSTEPSPDGEYLMYIDLGRIWGQGKVIIASQEGRSPLRSIDLRGDAYSWTPDGRALTFLRVRDVAGNLWEQPLDGSEPRQLTNFPSPGISKYAFSPNGKHLAAAKTKFTSDVVLIKDLK